MPKNITEVRMKLEIDPNGVWYHGSNVIFALLAEGERIGGSVLSSTDNAEIG